VSDSKTVTFQALPAINAGPDQTVCADVTTVTMQGYSLIQGKQLLSGQEDRAAGRRCIYSIGRRKSRRYGNTDLQHQYVCSLQRSNG
jgi:hypothetical protein